MVQFSDGFVPVEAIPAMIEDADIGLVPLRLSSGTDIMLPTKLLEYVFIGIPCIVPRTRTIARYFDDEMVAFFAEGDAGSLADTIVHLYRHPDVREDLARQATERFSRTYRWTVHKAIYVDLVTGLLGGERRGRRIGQPSG